MKSTYKTITLGYIHLLCLAISLSVNFSTYAQQDTIFWFAAPDVSSAVGDSPVHLRLMTYDQPANVTISQPANGGFTPINVAIPANDVAHVDLSAFLADIESAGADIVGATGLRIVSDELITAYYELSSGSNKEIFSLLISFIIRMDTTYYVLNTFNKLFFFFF